MRDIKDSELNLILQNLINDYPNLEESLSKDENSQNDLKDKTLSKNIELRIDENKADVAEGGLGINNEIEVVVRPRFAVSHMLSKIF